MFLKWFVDFNRKNTIGEVLENLGSFGKLSFFGNQEITLLKCQKNNEIYYVLECKISAALGFNYQWYKLTTDDLRILKGIIDKSLSI